MVSTSQAYTERWWAGSSHEFLAHVRGPRQAGLATQFSVGVAITKPVRAAITAAEDWVPALDGDGSLRDGAELVELTNYLNPGLLDSFPAGTRLICRRERPHPGAQLSLFDTINGPLATAEPKKLRYRLLHVAAKLTRTARTTTLRIAQDWPWTNDLIRAFERLAVLPEPVT